jgi:hypothetical protein
MAGITVARSLAIGKADLSSKSSSASGSGKRERCPDGVRDERVWKCRGDPMLRLPARAMCRDDDVGCHFGKRRDGWLDDFLEAVTG